MHAHVRLDGQTIQLLGGDPGGLDGLHKIVASWAGWARRPSAVSLPGGGRCSLYQSRVWPSTIVPLLGASQIVIEWQEGLKDFLSSRVLGHLESAKTELEPPPGHAAPLKWADEWADRKPMPHQIQAIRALGFLDYRAMLTDDMGLGKTASSIWAWQQSGARRVLIVCPKTVKRNWVRELRGCLREVGVHLIDGTPNKRASICSEMRMTMNAGDPMRFAAIINYDLLHRLPDRERDIVKAWAEGQFLICDESHYLKNRDAGRSRFVLQHLALTDGGAGGRLLLSGTPVRNTLEDLWTQVQIVRPGVWSSFHQFDKFHLIRAPMVIDTGKKRRDGSAVTKTITPVRQSKNRDQLNAIMNTLQVRRKKEDVLDLPDKIFTYPEFELEPASAKVYKAMKDQCLMELADLGDDTPIFHPQAKSFLEATLRLEQIAQGFLGGLPEGYIEKITPLIAKTAEKIPGRPGHLIFPKSVKIEWLIETVKSIILQGGRPVVFSRFNTPLFWLVNQWPGAEILHGGLNMEQRDDIIDRFQKNGVPVLFCQVKIAEGFNLTSSQDVLFYGRDWSPAINSQAADRCHRIGQMGTVNVQIPIVMKTFEEYLDKKLAAKDADAQQALKSITVGELRNAL